MFFDKRTAGRSRRSTGANDRCHLLSSSALQTQTYAQTYASGLLDFTVPRFYDRDSKRPSYPSTGCTPASVFCVPRLLFLWVELLLPSRERGKGGGRLSLYPFTCALFLSRVLLVSEGRHTVGVKRNASALHRTKTKRGGPRDSRKGGGGAGPGMKDTHPSTRLHLKRKGKNARRHYDKNER